MKYLAIQDHNKFIHIIESSAASYTPAGWHKPTYGGTMDMRNGRFQDCVFPVKKRTALVNVPHMIVAANNTRIVDDQTCQELDRIDAQMATLKKQRYDIIIDRFLTFPLVAEADLAPSRFTHVYPTKAEAIKAFSPAGGHRRG